MSGAVERMTSGATWDAFCDLLRAAGEEVLRPGIDDPLDVAEGYRMLTRLLRGALENALEYGDPLHPELICTCHETIKIVAENPDNLYLGSAISGRERYRIWGTRGEARWMSLNVFSGGGFGGGGRGVGATLHEDQLTVDAAGGFSVVLSVEPPAPGSGDWLPLTSDASSVVVRQTFLRKGEDRPAELHIERLDADGAPPRPLSAEHLERALAYAGFYVRGVAGVGAKWADRQAESRTGSSTCSWRTRGRSRIRRSPGTRRTGRSPMERDWPSSSRRRRATTG